jgi:hypothetical protein
MQEPLAKYHNSTTIRAVSITDMDIAELQQIVAEGLRTDESLDLAIKSQDRDRTIEASNVTSLLKQLNGTIILDSLQIDFHVRTESGRFVTTKHVSVELHRNCAVRSYFYVTSTDQTWCYGTSHLLAEFLRRRRLWYWGVAGEDLPWLFSMIIPIQLAIFVLLLLIRSNIAVTLVSGLSFLASIIIGWLAVGAVVFPGFIFKLAVASRPTLLMNQAFWTIFAAIATVVSTIVGILSLVLQLLR